MVILLLGLDWVAERPGWCLLGVLDGVLARRRDSIMLVLLLLGATEEGLGSARLGQNRFVVARTRGLLRGLSHLLNVTLRSCKSESFSLVRCLEALLTCCVAVVRGSGHNELLLALVGVVVLFTACAPGALLSRVRGAIVFLNGAGHDVIARSWSVDLLGLKVGLRTQR